MVGSDQKAKLVAILTKLQQIMAFADLAFDEARALAWDFFGSDLDAGARRLLPDDSRAQAGAQGTVIGLVIVGATLIIGVVVYASIESAAPTNHSMASTQQQVTDNVASGFDLGSILPIVMAAAAILGLLMSGFVGGGGDNGGRR